MQYSNPIDLAKSRGVSRGFVPLTSRFLQAAMEKAEIAARDKAAAEKAAAEKVSRQVSKIVQKQSKTWMHSCNPLKPRDMRGGSG